MLNVPARSRALLSGIRSRFALFPCLIFLSGVLNGSAAVLFLADPPADAVFLFAIPGLLAAAFLFGVKETFLRFVPAVCLAAVSSVILISGRKSGFAGEMGQYDRLGGSAVFRLTDSSLCGGIPEWMPNMPYYVQAELQSAEAGGTAEMRSVSGKVLLTMPPAADPMRKAGYGDLIRAEGYFERIPERHQRGTFDFPAYAAARGTFLLFHAEQAEILERGDGILRRLYDSRSRFLKKLTAGMSGTARKMAPALLFGIRQSIAGEVKDSFLHSGTLHILSVSGFHIGLFFLAVMMFLRGVPYRIRWFSAPFPVLIYALSTGMQAPAFRAFLMLAFWCLSHVFLRRERALNALAGAAAVILLLNPLQLFDMGFQYSFLTVFFLLISGEFLQGTVSAMVVREQFLPDRKKFSLRRLTAKLAGVIGVSVAAWLCSMEISLCSQSLFCPWAVPAYLLMLPLTWYCFILFLPAVLLQWIPGATEFAGILIRPALKLCADSAENFAEAGSLYVSPPPLWLAGIFLIALGGIFLFRRRSAVLISAVVMFCAGMFSLFPFSAPEPELAVFRGSGSSVPSIVFCDPVSRSAVILNVSGSGTARLVSDHLRTCGIGTAEEVHFESAGIEFCGGGLIFLRRNGAKAVYFHGKVPAAAKTARKILDEVPPPMGKPLLILRKEKDRSEAQIRMRGFEGVLLRLRHSENTGHELEIVTADGEILRRKYPFSTECMTERIPVRRQRKAAF